MGTLVSSTNSKIEHESVCVLYDPETGTISHTHRAVTMTGGKQPTHAEIESAALSIAGRMGKDTSRLRLLHADAAVFASRGVYRVDPESKTITKVRDLSDTPPVRQP